MKNIGQIQPANKPAKDKISSADQHSNPRSQMSWGGVHTSQHVETNNRVACDIVYFHGGSAREVFKLRKQLQIDDHVQPPVQLEKRRRLLFPVTPGLTTGTYFKRSACACPSASSQCRT